jgi:hypothetical protein
MRVILAHGAAGSSATMRPYVDGMERRGVTAGAIDLPVRRAEDAISAYRRVAMPDRLTVIGGHSYGGRVASLLAAEEGTEVAGLVLLSYPLHRPGRPDPDERTRHWTRITCPVLLCSGESDPFARIDLLRDAVAERLPRARLVTYPGLGHGLLRVADDLLDEVAAFVAHITEGVSPGSSRG